MIPLWASFWVILIAVAVLGVLFGRNSFNTTVWIYRFNERSISTIAIGYVYFIAYAFLRTSVLSALGVSAEYLASEDILLELALVIPFLVLLGWKSHCFIRENNVNVKFNGLKSKIWISAR